MELTDIFNFLIGFPTNPDKGTVLHIGHPNALARNLEQKQLSVTIKLLMERW